MNGDEQAYIQFIEKSASWYRFHANKSMILFMGIRFVLTILSASLPALTTLKADSSFVTASAIVIAILTALDTQFKWGDEWRQYRTTQLGLESLIRLFRGGALVPEKTEAEQYLKLVQDAETLITTDAERFFKFRISTGKARS